MPQGGLPGLPARVVQAHSSALPSFPVRLHSRLLPWITHSNWAGKTHCVTLLLPVNSVALQKPLKGWGGPTGLLEGLWHLMSGVGLLQLPLLILHLAQDRSLDPSAGMWLIISSVRVQSCRAKGSEGPVVCGWSGPQSTQPVPSA